MSVEFVFGLFEFVCPQAVKQMIVTSVIKSLCILSPGWVIRVCQKITHNLCICEYTNINFSFLLKIVALILSQLIKFMQDFYLLSVVSQIQLAHFKFKSSKVLTSPGILSRRGCCLSSTNHIRTGSYPFAPFITNAQTKRTKPQWKRCVGPANACIHKHPLK